MAEYTIDELARAAKLPGSTIRMYQSRKLLASPKRRGRVGFYDDGHLERLRAIERLKSSGFSLAAITGLLEANDNGETLGAVLGLKELSSEPVRLSLEELADRFPDQELTQSSVELALSLGLMRFDNGAVVLDRPEFLDVGTKLSAFGIPLDLIIKEYQALYHLAQEMASRFTSLFETQLWDSAVTKAELVAILPKLDRALNEMGPLAEVMVAFTFKRALSEEARAFAERHSDVITAVGKTDKLHGS